MPRAASSVSFVPGRGCPRLQGTGAQGRGGHRLQALLRPALAHTHALTPGRELPQSRLHIATPAAPPAVYVFSGQTGDPGSSPIAQDSARKDPTVPGPPLLLGSQAGLLHSTGPHLFSTA